ncbi:uncharacterized protein [Palaemon carinicauda]|uniref:uncharacterized protein n=1 Tax=Palaemon carinicauda TaxID=392227 RepID=UPI0035B65DF8
MTVNSSFQELMSLKIHHFRTNITVKPYISGTNATVRSSRVTLLGKWLLTSQGGLLNSPPAYVAFHNSCKGELNSSLAEMTLEMECCKRPAMLRRRSNSSPLFVAYVLTGKDFTNVQKIFDSEEHRRSSWLILLSPGMSSAINGLHLPLDHKAVFAIVHNDDDTKPFSVDLWDIYKAAPHFAPKKIFLGRWSSKEWRPSHDGSHQEPSWKEPRPDSEQERVGDMPPSLEWKEQQDDLLLPFFIREPWERRNDLMGLVLRCTTLQVYPYIMYDGVNKDGTVLFDSMRGINGELFHILKQIMNFT